jgi:hypothetical protein
MASCLTLITNDMLCRRNLNSVSIDWATSKYITLSRGTLQVHFREQSKVNVPDSTLEKEHYKITNMTNETHTSEMVEEKPTASHPTYTADDDLKQGTIILVDDEEEKSILKKIDLQ